MADPQDFFSLDGRETAVTGAGSGPGRRASRVLSLAGAHVVAVERINNDLHDLVSDIGVNGTVVVEANTDKRAERNAARARVGRNGRLKGHTGPLLFFCSKAASCMTGQIFLVDGGSGAT